MMALTFLAICTLVMQDRHHQLAVVLHPGHRPVVKERDLAQPSAIRIDCEPTSC
jgi:hypothetical protein